MTSSTPAITSHPSFRFLSNDFFKPYPPYVLVTSGTDAKSVLDAGCEAEYLIVLDAVAPEGSKKLSSSDVKEYRERIGLLALDLRSIPDISGASQVLSLLSTGGTMIGFASPEAFGKWKSVSQEWAQQEKVINDAGKEQDGVILEWNSTEKDGWTTWSMTKKAPDWAFC
ncbi:hypothetical protein FRC12_010027 [Ceratobasidium sp. 428]|nr:hypothetical protein FRC09_017497 [Ceratobasidium sp. 395]KAG8758367.1 hypothetical protein FRC12_010027 [Ceratobasidium sp. 428]